MRPIRTILSLTLAFAMIIGCAAFAAGEEAGGTPVLQTAPDNDFRTDLQYSYLMDPDPENVYAYARGAEQLSAPKGIVCDFSGDGIGEAESYLVQRASSEDFSAAAAAAGACVLSLILMDSGISSSVPSMARTLYFWRKSVSSIIFFISSGFSAVCI